MIWKKLLDLVFPKNAVCMGCGSKAGFEGEWLCPACRRALAKNWKGAFQEDKLDGSAAAYQYGGPAGSVVRYMKYIGVLELTDMMTDDMLRAWNQVLPADVEMVVPVPMHPRRLRTRGFNQSEVLAKSVAEKLNLPCENALIRTRNTVQQARLTGKARKKNLKDAFRAEDFVNGKWVLLVDDVYTTGTTAHECAAALRAAGARYVSYLAYTIGVQEGKQ